MFNEYYGTLAILNEWISKRGHERCHSHQDLFVKLCELYQIPIPSDLSDLPSRCEFHEGCLKYQDLLFGKELENGNSSTCH